METTMGMHRSFINERVLVSTNV